MSPYRHETALFGPPYWSSRQRVVILTFETSAEAEAWDLAGQPLQPVAPVSASQSYAAGFTDGYNSRALFQTVEVDAPGTFTGRRTVILRNKS